MHAFRQEEIFSYPVTTMSKAACVQQVLSWMESMETGKYCVCANPHSLEEAHTDLVFAKAIRDADLVIPDGVGIVMASKSLGGEIRDRVTGSDIFEAVTAALNEQGGYRVFFMGSTEETLKRIREKMQAEYPRLKVGTYSPPFKSDFNETDNQAMIEAVNMFSPDVLWVGMSAPKQEKWIYLNKDCLDVRFIGAVGAVFDFFTGNVKRSHPLFQRAGLEWLPRLMQQPRKLWRRNFVSTPRFLIRVIKARQPERANSRRILKNGLLNRN